jgi:hypothetical protein
MTIHFTNPDDRSEPIYTREGLTEFLLTDIRRPALRTRQEYESLTQASRLIYDEVRLSYLAGGIVVNTPQLTEAKTRLVKLSAENFSTAGDHNGLMLNGGAYAGKTFTTTTLMRFIRTMYAKQFPNFDVQRYTPVVYVLVPTGCTPKTLMLAFAHFFGMTVGATETTDSIKHRVVATLNASHTQLVVVDDLQNLGAADRGNGKAADVLRQIHHSVRSTFIYAGINLPSNPLFDGPLGQQLLRRYSTIDLPTFNLSEAEHRAAWQRIIASFEALLPLADHELGTLPELSGYLHDRTGGNLGSLKKLLTGTAAALINDAKNPLESITQKALSSYRLDDASERYYRDRRALIQTKKVA